jgi:type II secretory pathway pseudopilin PulG
MVKQAETTLSPSSPYTFLAAMALPNFMKAVQTLARNQTLANEAFLACGLERYRLAHGQYPETLEALVPQFAEKVPHDIVGGQPLRYSRTADGRFELYSLGWNGKDDGGAPGKTTAEGDWVWP